MTYTSWGAGSGMPFSSKAKDVHLCPFCFFPSLFRPPTADDKSSSQVVLALIKTKRRYNQGHLNTHAAGTILFRSLLAWLASASVAKLAILTRYIPLNSPTTTEGCPFPIN